MSQTLRVGELLKIDGAGLKRGFASRSPHEGECVLHLDKFCLALGGPIGEATSVCGPLQDVQIELSYKFANVGFPRLA